MENRRGIAADLMERGPYLLLIRIAQSIEESVAICRSLSPKSGAHVLLSKPKDLKAEKFIYCCITVSFSGSCFITLEV
jgi:hypothetical protein